MKSLKDVEREIEAKEKELDELKERKGQIIKDNLLKDLVPGNYYAITSDEEWENYRTIYIVKYTGDNIYSERRITGTWYIHYDGPVIVHNIITAKRNDCYKTIERYVLTRDEEDTIYDKLDISVIDISDVKKIMKDLIKAF